MKKLISFWSLFTIVMVAMLSLSISFVSCSKDEIEEDDFEQTQNVSNQDPEGTIVLNMTSGAENNYYKIGDLGEIHIDAANNFRGKNGSSYKIAFVTLGKVEGLSKVNIIPSSGWAESAAVVPGTGYMMRYTTSNSYWDQYGNVHENVQYARIFVVDYLTTATTDEFGMTTGSNSGATIKYQAPLQQSIILDNNSITFPNKGGRQCVKFEYPTHLNIKKQPNWCDVQLFMDSVVVNVGSNADSLRSGTIILTNVTGEATISVAQGAVEAISLEKISLSFSNKASSQTIKLKTPTYYEIDTLPNWCNAQVYMDSIRISVQENISKTRAGEIVIKNAISKATIKISQSAVTAISVDSTSLTFPYNASSQTIKLKAPTLYNVENKLNWCTTQVYMDSLVVSVQKNTAKERTGELTLVNDASNVTIKIIQVSYPSINLEKTSLTFSSKASSQTVKLNIPTTIQLVDKPEWCSVSTSSDSVVVSVIENYCASQRTGNVVFENEVGKATLKVKQKASSSPLFEKGLGTVNEPYQINSAQQLENINKSLDSHFVLTADIDLKSYLYEYGNGWEPISNFTGSLDGKGHTITGLWIKRPNTDNIGLFGNISNSTISNLKVDIDDLGLTGRKLVGAIVAEATNSYLSKCIVNGNVTGSGDRIGGLCGSSSGNIDNCFVTGTITGGDNYLGGLCGTHTGNIENCSVTGTIKANYSTSGQKDVGGLCGTCSGNINNCSVIGNIGIEIIENIGYAYNAGGLSGSYHGNIKNSYAAITISYTGEVYNYHYNAGGLCGVIDGSSTIEESKTEGSITSNGIVAGIVGNVGYSNCNITNCYSYASLSGHNCYGISLRGTHLRCYFAGEVLNGSFSCGGTYTYFDSTISGQSGSNGYSTEEMMKQATYESWDFKKIWKITEGKTYPTLRCFDK